MAQETGVVTSPPAQPRASAKAAKKAAKAEAKRKQRLQGSWREIVTPEGVPVRMELASRGERLGAVLLDLFIMTMVPVVLIIAIGLASVGSGFWDMEVAQWAGSLLLVAFFLWRNFYFTFFELQWQGTTPGKKAMGIRVVDRRGGQLTSGAIFARNLLRELELFLPISILLSSSSTLDGALYNLFATIWALVFLLIPFFNRDRLRAGDMIGGTWVVRNPKTALMGDLVERKRRANILPGGKRNRAAEEAESGIRFTDEQVDAYGIYELQTLEDLLRRPNVPARTLGEVRARIQNKIGWKEQPGQKVSDRAFLEAYYAALRRRLEARMLFGVRRKNKHDRGQDKSHDKGGHK